MKIGIIGSGNIGGTAARLFVRAGHEVAVSNSRGPESLRKLVAELGSAGHAMTVEDAARFGEVVLLAVPWRSPEALPKPGLVSGKIVIDAMNPYRPDGGILDLGASTSSGETAKRLPGARLVKAFNTIYYQHLASRGHRELPADERHAIFVSGDDAAAKDVVKRLIEEIGFAPVDTGSLEEGGRKQQPGSPIYNHPMSGREGKLAVAGLTHAHGN
ncbi:MAG TPA: NADPH-dependent F420 reductase [Bryobacteraceae bacterium]|nr:NADPH-dependent F420 reductase [Bryobacteraceae bacterium]